MSGLLVAQIPVGNYVVPQTPPAELAHATYFEEFDGLMPLDNAPGEMGLGYSEGGQSPRPGQQNTPLTALAYTRGAIPGITGKLGGQPLPVADPFYRVGRGYTPSSDWAGNFQRTHYGVGQNYQGVAQTVQLSEITGNPPIPGDLTGILAGLS